MTILSALYRLLISPIELLIEFIFALGYRHFHKAGLSVIFMSLAFFALTLPLFYITDKKLTGDQKPDGRPLFVFRRYLSFLLQIPFFIAANHFLSGLQILKRSSFGPIGDLEAPDALLSAAGITINVLPILLTLFHFLYVTVSMKGSSLRSRIPAYVLTFVFFGFLYSSPAGLTLYFTIFNLLLLIQNIFFKYRYAGKALRIIGILSAAAVLIFLNLMLIRNPESEMRNQIIIAAAILLLIVLLVFLTVKPNIRMFAAAGKKDLILFLICAVFLTIQAGIQIPSDIIKASPTEFIDLNLYYSPLWYIPNSFLTAAGTFIIWAGIIYQLLPGTHKKWMELVMLILACCSKINYSFFGKNLGEMSDQLVYDSVPTISFHENLLNILILTEAVILLFFLWKRRFFLLKYAVLSLCLSSGILSFMNFREISLQLDGVRESIEKRAADAPELVLSKNGKNVIILMMDRSIGYYLPFLMGERSELVQQYDGFTFYPNTLSFATKTNVALPPLYGGYEYTPVKMNERADTLLGDKHNEMLRMMPVLFDNAGYKVTICNPTYAGYQWISDLSIYDDYPNMKTYMLRGKFSSEDLLQASIDTRNRNFFCYSIYKTSPLAVQPMLYTGGLYNEADALAGRKGRYSVTQTVKSMRTAVGLPKKFENVYSVLYNLPSITTVTDDAINTYLSIDNTTTHEPTLLQLPDYVPAYQVDNTEFEQLPIIKHSIDGRELKIGTKTQIQYYHVNMAAYMLIGKWMDYLRENDVYDNTRIIIAADHGQPQGYEEHLFGTREYADVLSFNPILMVKDFNSKGFSMNEQFMTNAEVPSIATAGLFEAPSNPFTGVRISDEDLNDPVHSVQIVMEPMVWINNGNTFLPGVWYDLHGNDIFDLKNWEEKGLY